MHILLQIKEKTIMTSKSVKLKLIRKRKQKSNKPNQKTHQKIIDQNYAIANKE